MKRRLILASLAGLLIILTVSLWLGTRSAEAPGGDSPQTNRLESPETTPQPDQEPEPEPAEEPAFDREQHSLTDPASLWVIVNKQNPLPDGYTPAGLTTPKTGGAQLRREAANALDKMVAAAKSDGVSLKLISGFRSQSRQSVIYNNYVARDGRAAADRYSARPGHSEHQTGWVADVGQAGGACDLEICFANTAAGKWVARHAHKYGFIIRYLNGKEAVTGYQYEPWHLRYVGPGLAGQIFAAKTTMEEFFGWPAAPGY